MEREELTLARILFKYKVHTSSGQKYEDLFVEIMQLHNPNFIPVKPQGSIGDRKNDGYNRNTGTYYQVFAPEEPKLKAQDAVDKLVKDFTGLMSHWNAITPVQEFHFVFNDKYHGTFATIESNLSQIKSNNGLRDCTVFLSRHLEDIFFRLSDDEIQTIVGFLPNPTKLELIDYSILSEVLQHIMESPPKLGKDSAFIVPDFGEKIKFNNLDTIIGNWLSVAGYQVGHITKFFELNSNFARQGLRNQLNAIYQESLTKGFDDSNLVFYDILFSIMPKNTQSVQNAALVVMAYFFESCDIFEEPNSTESV